MRKNRRTDKELNYKCLVLVFRLSKMKVLGVDVNLDKLQHEMYNERKQFYFLAYYLFLCFSLVNLHF